MQMTSRFASAIVGTFVLLTAGCGRSTPDGPVQAASKNLPALQSRFCAGFGPPNAEYHRLMEARDSERNPIKKETIQTQIDGIDLKFWNDQYALIGPSGEFKDWRGKLSFRRRGNVDRDKLLAFVDVCDDGHSIGTGSEESFILLASPMGQTLASFDVQKDAIVSGNFLWSKSGSPWHFTQAVFGAGIGYRFNGPLLVRFTSVTQAR
jgi:hypothetical protein